MLIVGSSRRWWEEGTLFKIYIGRASWECAFEEPAPPESRARQGTAMTANISREPPRASSKAVLSRMQLTLHASR